jgi:hypothetical protein
MVAIAEPATADDERIGELLRERDLLDAPEWLPQKQPQCQTEEEGVGESLRDEEVVKAEQKREGHGRLRTCSLGCAATGLASMSGLF